MDISKPAKIAFSSEYKTEPSHMKICFNLLFNFNVNSGRVEQNDRSRKTSLQRFIPKET